MGLILAALLKARSDGVAAQVAVQAQTDMEAARVRIDERLGPLGLLTLLAGCGAGGGGSFCVAAAPIYVAAEDVLTTETALAILAHDEAGARLCGWRAAKGG